MTKLPDLTLFRKGGIHEVRDAGKKEIQGMQERRNAGKKGCMKGGIQERWGS